MSSRKLLSALSMLGAASAASNSSAGTTTSGSACACNALASSYPDLLLFPNSTDYATESIANWDKRANMEPACIFLPTSADEVAKAVGTFNTCDAQFAVRGGGHMNYPGSNNINGGVLMALSGLSDLKIAADNSSIEVGPGNRWVDVYNFLDPYGRIAIGGRLKTIGVPGLTLIGGVHYFINKYGYAMDNVISYDVVLGDGSQVTASANSSSDLFWALKGGANNFGVVTKFVLKTHSVPQISTTIQAFDETEVQSFIQAVCDFTDASDASIGAGAVITISYNATTGVISPSLLGVQEGTESPPSRFANFSAIPGVMKINNVTTPKQWAANLDTPLQMFRIQFGQHAIKTDADQIYELYKIWRDALDEIADVEGIYPTFVLNTAPASAAAVANTNGIGNTWGLDDDDYIWWQLSTAWDNAEDDLRVQTWSKRLVTYMHSLNKEKGLSSEFVYMGDAGEWQDVFAGFAEGNVDKMKSIRSKYDSNGVFTRLNWGGFKLGM